jgi:hypothetical protein
MSEPLKMVLLPKFLGILVFDQANEGAMEANADLGNPAELEFLGPTPENSVAGQIEIVTTAATQGVDAIMISNNAEIRLPRPPKRRLTPEQRWSLGTRRSRRRKGKMCSSPRWTSMRPGR